MSMHASEALRIDPDFVLPILEVFVREEVQKTGMSNGIVGLSGGLDSVIAATIMVRALGPDCTRLVVMPHEVSSETSIEDAHEVAGLLGVEPVVVPITAMTRGYPHYSGLDRVRAGNLMARMRMAVLYDLSVEHEALVIGTSNKTELLLGYGTLFGDTACALNPLGDLYKTQLQQLAPALAVPESIQDKVPSAELWEGQTDEGELGVEYETADAILYHLIDEKLPMEEVVEAGFDRVMVEDLLERVRGNEFKRRMPIICKLS